MPILTRLTALYEAEGFQIVTGLAPRYCNNFAGDYTFLLKDGAPCTPHLGIALQEVYCLECLFESLVAKNILVIGNSFAWSTFALALANPEARVVAMDIADEPFTSEWIERTNTMARAAGLNVTAVKGTSPDDVPEILESHFESPLDFAFLDGGHTPDQIAKDFEAIHAHAAPNAVYLFHDVLGFNLQSGLQRIVEASGLVAAIMWSTPSGMALAFHADRAGEVSPALNAFGATPLANALAAKLRNTEAGRISGT
jgi:hypothetical protein